MKRHENTVVTLTTAADSVSAWIDCRGWDSVIFQTWWASLAGVSGELYIQGSPDGVNGIYTFVNGDLAWFGNPAVVASTAGVAVVAFEVLMNYMRIGFTGTGGAASHLNALVTRR